MALYSRSFKSQESVFINEAGGGLDWFVCCFLQGYCIRFCSDQILPAYMLQYGWSLMEVVFMIFCMHFSGLYCMEIFGECLAWRLPDWAIHHMWITTLRGFRRLGFWSDGAICGEELDGHRIKKSIQVDVSSLILLTWFSSQGFSIPSPSCSCSSLSSYVFQNSPYSIENST